MLIILILLAGTTLAQTQSGPSGHWYAFQDSQFDTLNWNLTGYLIYVEPETKYNYREARTVCLDKYMSLPMSNWTEIQQMWLDKEFKGANVDTFDDEWKDLLERKPFICASRLQGVILGHPNGTTTYLDTSRDILPSHCYPQLQLDYYNEYYRNNLALCMLIHKTVLM